MTFECDGPGVQRVPNAGSVAELHYANECSHTRTPAHCNAPESAIVRECALRFITSRIG